MASSAACDAVQQVLEGSAGMDRWAAKGAIQLALMDAGLDAGGVTVAEMQVVVTELLPRQLETQKVSGVTAVCDKIRVALKLVGDGPAKDSPDRVFLRLGR
ncbi:MAG TPA: hypothetical protein VMR31_05205 [Myxococcota bacterium]|nr:hypothetical protein [Myxococcota bacterium]